MENALSCGKCCLGLALMYAYTFDLSKVGSHVLEGLQVLVSCSERCTDYPVMHYQIKGHHSMKCILILKGINIIPACILLVVLILCSWCRPVSLLDSFSNCLRLHFSQA
jgi:hypothetical protein